MKAGSESHCPVDLRKAPVLRAGDLLVMPISTYSHTSRISLPKT